MSIYQLKGSGMLLFVNICRLIFLPISLQKNDNLILNKIIEKIIINEKDLFHKNNYHLNINGHEKISNSL